MSYCVIQFPWKRDSNFSKAFCDYLLILDADLSVQQTEHENNSAFRLQASLVIWHDDEWVINNIHSLTAVMYMYVFVWLGTHCAQATDNFVDTLEWFSLQGQFGFTL